MANNLHGYKLGKNNQFTLFKLSMIAVILSLTPSHQLWKFVKTTADITAQW